MKKYLIVILCFISLSTLSQEEKRLALVIGNSNYDKGALKNPVNDAALIRQTLEELDFEVIYATNLERKRSMVDKIAEFGRKRSNFDVGFVYYAGHGIQVGGENYLLPTKEIFESEYDVEDYGVSVQKIMRYLTGMSQQVNVLILDACRDNPFENNWNNSRSIKGSGLAKIPPPTGSLIAFSTSANTTASDGSGDNSYYCQSLSKNLRLENTSIDQVFRNVRSDVIKATNGKQTPEEASKLVGNAFYLSKTVNMSLAEKLVSLKGEELELFLTNYLKQNLESKKTEDTTDYTADDYFALGYDAYNKSNYIESINYFTKSLQKDSTNSMTFINLAACKNSIRDYEGALINCSKAIDIDLKNAMSGKDLNENSLSLAYTNRAMAKISLNEINSALKDCNEAIHYDSKNNFAYINRASIKLVLKDYNGSIEDCNKAIALDSNNCDALIGRAGAKVGLKDYFGTLDDCNKAIALDSSKSLAYVNRANAKYHLTDFAGALVDCDKAIELDSNSYYGFAHRAIIKNELKDFNGALVDGYKAVEINPKEKMAYVNLSKNKVEMGDFVGAIIDLNKAIELDSTESILYGNRAQIKLSVKDYEGAIIDCNKSIELDSINPVAYLNRANAKTYLTDINGAMVDVNKAIKIDSTISEAYVTRSFLKLKFNTNKKTLKSALEDCNKAIELDSSVSMSYVNSSNIKLRLKNYSGSINDSYKALSRNPNEYLAYANLAFSKLEQKDYKGAITDLNLAIKKFPNIGMFYALRGEINKKRKYPYCDDYRKACELGFVKFGKTNYCNIYNKKCKR